MLLGGFAKRLLIDNNTPTQLIDYWNDIYEVCGPRMPVKYVQSVLYSVLIDLTCKKIYGQEVRFLAVLGAGGVVWRVPGGAGHSETDL